MNPPPDAPAPENSVPPPQPADGASARTLPGWVLDVMVPLAALTVSLIAGLLLLWLLGYPAASVPGNMIRKTFGDGYGLAQVSRQAGLLALAGMAVTLAFRAGLFNIGVEGQALMGGLAIAWVTAWLIPARQSGGWAQAIPGWGWSLILLGVGMVGGGLYAGLAGLLKAWRGAHEVITTILLNFVAFAAINYALRPETGSLAVRGMMRTARVPSDLRLPRASEWLPGITGSNLTLGTGVALLALVVMAIWLGRSRGGYETRVTGLNPEAARWAGIHPGWVMVRAMFLSGALAGIIAYESILGAQGWMEEGFTAGVGFSGIAVAMIAGLRPILILPAALLFASLSYGRVAVGGDVPKDIVDVIQALAILSMAVGGAWAARRRLAAS
jgi:simple sugar transport system permease protein